jgi:CubicO group peptidase (beta-lactamase class C family)
MSLLDYARPRLFDPLGISTRPAAEPVALPENLAAYDKAGFAWPTDPKHVHLGHSDLKLTPGDLIRFGTLYLNGGRWEGRQLVPEVWVRESTKPQTSTDHLVPGGGYGYEWWTTTVDGDPAFSALGMGGQLIAVVPSRRVVVVVSCDVTLDDPNLGLMDTPTAQLGAEIARAI